MTPVIINGTGDYFERLFSAVSAEGAPVLIGADQFTRFRLHMGSLVFDSQLLNLGSGQPFDNTQALTVTFEGKRQTVNTLRIALGGQAIAAGTYRECALVCFDGSNPNGLTWARGFTVKVFDL